MIKIIFLKNENRYVGFECSGHAGFADFGKDIICASVSSIVQSTCLGFIKVLKLKVDMSRDDNKGYLKLVTPKKISDKDIENSNLLFNVALVSLKDLESGYSDYIKIEEKSYVY